MPFITGSQPWLKPYMLAALAHPPNSPSLNAHYLQAVSPVSTRRELTVYDGHFIIPAVISQSAASLLDADEDDTGVTTRNLLGHVLAPVSVVVVPDMTTTPPTATLLIKDVRVFADRVHQRPVGRVPLVYTDPEVCDALRAIVGRQLASYATATVLERADRAAGIQIGQPPETDTFFEKLLHDQSIPPSGLLSASEAFPMHERRGAVVGGGGIGHDDSDALAIIPENPTPPEADKSKKPHESTPGGSQSNQRDPDWDIEFTQDPAEGGGIDNVGADPLPQTQHFAVDDEDDDNDDDNDDVNDDDNDDEDGARDDHDDDETRSGVDGRKSVGERRIQDIVQNAQEDTLDGQPDSSPAKRNGQTGEESPSGENSRNKKNTVTTPQNTNKGSLGNDGEGNRKKDTMPQKRTRSMETRSRNSQEQERSNYRPDSRSKRPTSSGMNPGERPTDKELEPRAPKPSPSSKTVVEMAKRTPSETPSSPVSKSPQGSPGRVTRSSTKNIATGSPRRKGSGNDKANESRTVKDGEGVAGLSSPRRSPRIVMMKTPPRRPRTTEEPGGKSSEDGAISKLSLRSPLRRSPRVQRREKIETLGENASRHSPLTRLQVARAAHLGSSTPLKERSYKERGSEEEDDYDMRPEAAMDMGADKSPDNGDSPLQSGGKHKQDSESDSQRHGETDPPSRMNLPEADSVKAERAERGRKRKAPEISSPDKPGSKTQEEEEEPSCYSPEPFLDKIKAEIEEMKRFRERIDRNPDGYKTYPDGFLPSGKPTKHSVKRKLTFPPPLGKGNHVLDVPESAPM